MKTLFLLAFLCLAKLSFGQAISTFNIDLSSAKTTTFDGEVTKILSEENTTTKFALADDFVLLVFKDGSDKTYRLSKAFLSKSRSLMIYQIKDGLGEFTFDNAKKILTHFDFENDRLIRYTGCKVLSVK